MSYTSPVITASGITFSQAQAAGLSGHVAAVISSNSFSARGARYLRELEQPQRAIHVHRTAADIIEAYHRGAGVDQTDTLTHLTDIATAYKAYLAAIEEAAVLIAANTGTLVPVIGGHKRTFP